MEKKGKNIIFADEAYQHFGLPVVSLDNTRVGELAAEELFRNGFRSPALLTQDFSDHWYSPYLKRLQGFAAKCAELGMDYREERDCHRVFFEKGRLQSYIHQTEKIAEEKRYDSEKANLRSNKKNRQTVHCCSHAVVFNVMRKRDGRKQILQLPRLVHFLACYVCTAIAGSA